ncbi:MAG: hypothetical protein CM15mP120_08780 [Pseudomonadota bacterium]|nr:MAG: hypothetical protein CM15mP120_08780 [Pseudomonadota bacterium]
MATRSALSAKSSKRSSRNRCLRRRCHTRFYRPAYTHGCTDRLGSPGHTSIVARVTSILMGNCGVSFAPVRPDDKELLAEMWNL